MSRARVGVKLAHWEGCNRTEGHLHHAWARLTWVGCTVPRAFYQNHVVRAYRAWCADQETEWLAKVAVQEANILPERVFNRFGAGAIEVMGTTSPGRYRSELGARWTEFALVRDVAEAHKHGRITRMHPVPLVANSQHTGLQVIPIEMGGLGAGPIGSAPIGGGEIVMTPTIVIDASNGGRYRLYGVLTFVVTMWDNLLTQAGL